jgi:hypothetical protein
MLSQCNWKEKSAWQWKISCAGTVLATDFLPVALLFNAG